MSENEGVTVLETYGDGADMWAIEKRDGVHIETNARSGYERVTHPEDFRASFDLTRTWGRDVWRNLMDMFDLELYEVDVTVIPEDEQRTVLAWVGDDLVIRTTINPLTGERANYTSEEYEELYDPDENLAKCGYIHLEGEERAVREAFKHIKDNSNHKNSAVGEWCV